MRSISLPPRWNSYGTRSMVAAPDELMRVLPGLLEDVIIGRREAPLDRCDVEVIQRVAGDDVMPPARGFDVEARGAIAAAENPAGEVGARQFDNANIRQYSSKERPQGRPLPA